MSDTTTPLFGFTQPEDGASADTWGVKLNADFASLDTLIGVATGVVATIPDSGVLDLETAAVWRKTLANNITLSLINTPVDTPTTKVLRQLVLINNNANKIVTWPTGTVWLDRDHTAPAFPATNTWNAVLLIIADAGATIYGVWLNAPYISTTSGGTIIGGVLQIETVNLNLTNGSDLVLNDSDHIALTPKTTTHSSGAGARTTNYDLDTDPDYLIEVMGSGNTALTMNFANIPAVIGRVLTLVIDNSGNATAFTASIGTGAANLVVIGGATLTVTGSQRKVVQIMVIGTP